MWDGIKHFINMALSFPNVSGSLRLVPEYKSYRWLSWGIGEVYVEFVNERDLNVVGRGG